jgi:hypothetical protein
MGKIYLTLFLLPFLFLFSCKKEQSAPSFVYIPEINVYSVYNVSGSNSSKIKYVKVFNGNTLIGVYGLPVNVPIIANGETEIKCSALIENYDSPNNILNYEFYEFSNDLVVLESGKQDTIYPTVNYLSSTYAEYWYEDFESSGHLFAAGPNSNAPLIITDDQSEVFQGIGSGKFELSTDSSYSKYLTEENFIYNAGKNAFLELNYKNNQTFFFSLILHPNSGNTYKQPVFQFKNSTNENGELVWNKMYIEIGSILNGLTNLQAFDICFEMQRDESVSDPVVLIDNVKVIRKK